ncbi:MAG: hypothetical protein R3C61_28325 [Bacteroidia bacterium]
MSNGCASVDQVEVIVDNKPRWDAGANESSVWRQRGAAGQS